MSRVQTASRKRVSRPTLYGRSRTQSSGGLAKAREAEAVDRAMREMIRLDPSILKPKTDYMGSVADHLGIARSTLGTWASPNSDKWITTEGIRRFIYWLKRLGGASAASCFCREILSDALAIVSDSRDAQ